MGDVSVKVLMCESIDNPWLIRHDVLSRAICLFFWFSFYSHTRTFRHLYKFVPRTIVLSNGNYSRKFCPSSVLKTDCVGRRRKFGSKLKYPALRLKYLTSNLSLRERNNFTLTNEIYFDWYRISQEYMPDTSSHVNVTLYTFANLRINSRSDCLNLEIIISKKGNFFV